VRLVIDAGLDSEDTQYVRLRALTSSLGLKLVAAGERRDESGVIPVDADVAGWANEQNYNLQALEAAISYRTFTSAGAIAVGDAVGFDTTAGGGRLVKATATVGSPVGRSFANGIAISAASGAGQAVRVVVQAGSFVVATFDTAPSNSDQGKPVYLHTVAGQVSLTAPVASGTDVVRVGYLHAASSRTIQFLPQYVSTNP
jgi:hypothetical protein